MVSIKKISDYPTFSSNNWVKLRWQPKFPMALNGLTYFGRTRFGQTATTNFQKQNISDC